MTVLKSAGKLMLGLLTLMALLLAGVLLFVPGVHVSSLGMILNVMAGAGGDTSPDKLLARLQATKDYRISIFSRDLPNPRMLLRGAAGQLLVSNPRSGEILQLWDSNGDGAADHTDILLTGLKRPHGMELHEGSLYVAESNQVGRISYNTETGAISGDYKPVISGLTDEGNHWSKTVRIGPDGKMYVAMGSTCNVCEETDVRRATIMRYDTAGGAGEIYASGLRNSVGMAFAPWDGSLYATDNGRDLLGDDYPACELNRIEQDGFYGWPYLNGNNDLDPDFGAGRQALQKTARPPVYSFAAHNAPLGIYFPPDSSRTALVALHGSWNRSTPDGYKVIRLSWQNDAIAAVDFMWGFEQDGDIIGRPVDIVGDGAGGYFVSDDYARVVYRLSPHRGLRSVQTDTGERAGAEAEHWQLDSGLAEQGRELYQNLHCDDCHGAAALTPVPLVHLARRYNPETLTAYFLTPTPPMPRLELSLLQRQQLAHHLLTLDQSPTKR
jgi:glucose/arabinose dehydrogenase